MQNPIVIFWFRRDLRLYDNHGLFKALSSGFSVLPLFIFDAEILHKLENKTDARVEFIHTALAHLNKQLESQASGLMVKHGMVLETFEHLSESINIHAVYANHDYEPYARERDLKVKQLLSAKGIQFITFKDQVVFEKNEIVKSDGTPYSVFTPFSKRWKAEFKPEMIDAYPSKNMLEKLIKQQFSFPALGTIGFEKSSITVPSIKIDQHRLKQYESTRDFPAQQATTHVGPHLRFGTISIRELVGKSLTSSEIYLNELIWREFFMQILWHYPHVVTQNFNVKYNQMDWSNNEDHFQRWCNGLTGYPMVDAGMRQLNQTGFMHNRARMVTAAFLTKHLLIDWRWGEAYFASKLIDYELSSNNGNWQWASGTGCDAAPYFRVFNPTEQARKFDPQGVYIQQWIPELNSNDYPKPMVEHSWARERAIKAYQNALR